MMTCTIPDGRFPYRGPEGLQGARQEGQAESSGQSDAGKKLWAKLRQQSEISSVVHTSKLYMHVALQSFCTRFSPDHRLRRKAFCHWSGDVWQKSMSFNGHMSSVLSVCYQKMGCKLNFKKEQFSASFCKYSSDWGGLLLDMQYWLCKISVRRADRNEQLSWSILLMGT